VDRDIHKVIFFLGDTAWEHEKAQKKLIGFVTGWKYASEVK